MTRLVPGLNEADPGENELFRKWQHLYLEALNATKSCSERPGALIEVAAQHPLRNGLYPNAEFSARLDAAAELYRQLKDAEIGLVKVYVPGSIHMDNGVSDAISLSEAGCRYLVSRGIEANDLFGEDANLKYKGEIGVYNSSDECYVASRLFEDLAFGQIHSFCSPAQLLRKSLSYIRFGYVPSMHSVPVESMFHSYVDEAFLYIPRLLEDEYGLQKDSAEADRLRLLRKPQ